MLSGLSLQVLFDAAADAMLLVDDAGYVVHANASALQMFDYVENEIIGLNVEALMPSKHRQSHQKYRNKYFNKPEKRPMGKGKNLAALTRDGLELPVDIALSPIQAQGQHFTLVTLHSADRQINAEALLENKEVFTRTILDSIAGPIVVIDRDGKITDVNHAWKDFATLNGASKETLRGVGLNYFDVFNQILIDEKTHKIHAGLLAVLNKQRPSFRIEYPCHSPSEQRWYMLSASPMGKGPDGLVISHIDITDRKILEKKLQAQRVEMESLAKQQVAIQTASAIAHEINQPLAAISAYSEVALYALGAGDLDRERLSRSLEGCVTQSQRAGKSLHELLEFLQKGDVALVPIDLNEVIQKALNITQHNDYGGFHATLDLEPDLPHVLANPLQLQKVLVNILRNGIEAVHNAGVPIAAINVMVRTHADSNMAQVTIQDNGPGFSNETAKCIFEPFFTTKSKGIGMGLAVSRALVEANGGQLWFDPECSSGATFHFTLPLAGT